MSNAQRGNVELPAKAQETEAPRPLPDLVAETEKQIEELQKALDEGRLRLHRLIGRRATLDEMQQREKDAEQPASS